MAWLREMIKRTAFIWLPRWLLMVLVPSIPRRLSADPADHTDYQIGWNVAESWPSVVDRHIAENEWLMGPGQAAALRRIRLSVVYVLRLENNLATATIRPSFDFGYLPVWHLRCCSVRGWT